MLFKWAVAQTGGLVAQRGGTDFPPKVPTSKPFHVEEEEGMLYFEIGIGISLLKLSIIKEQSINVRKD